jgi:hypothetical protein
MVSCSFISPAKIIWASLFWISFWINRLRGGRRRRCRNRFLPRNIIKVDKPMKKTYIINFH